MARFIVARLFSAILLFFAVTLFVFIVFFVMPQPQIRQLGRGGNASEYDIHNALRLHGTLPDQYAQFTWGLVRHGSLGQSYSNRREVKDMMLTAAPVTLSLLAGGLVFWLLMAVPIGVLSALRPRSLLDRSGMVFVLIGVSAHPAWLGLVLGWLLGYRLHIFPFTGYCEIFSPTTPCGGPTQWAYHLLLPWFVFAFLYAAIYARMIRASVMETMDEEYVRTARAKGAGEAQVLRSHVIRNAMLPVVTMIGMDIGTALGGVIFIETVFGLPGLGGMLRGAIPGKDLPVILGVVTFTTIGILILNLLVDLTYAFIDPRVRMTEPSRARAPRSAGTRDAPASAKPATTTG
jgi:peptide/nickel transport system permease protein